MTKRRVEREARTRLSKIGAARRRLRHELLRLGPDAEAHRWRRPRALRPQRGRSWGLLRDGRRRDRLRVLLGHRRHRRRRLAEGGAAGQAVEARALRLQARRLRLNPGGLRLHRGRQHRVDARRLRLDRVETLLGKARHLRRHARARLHLHLRVGEGATGLLAEEERLHGLVLEARGLRLHLRGLAQTHGLRICERAGLVHEGRALLPKACHLRHYLLLLAHLLLLKQTLLVEMVEAAGRRRNGLREIGLMHDTGKLGLDGRRGKVALSVLRSG